MGNLLSLCSFDTIIFGVDLVQIGVDHRVITLITFRVELSSLCHLDSITFGVEFIVTVMLGNIRVVVVDLPSCHLTLIIFGMELIIIVLHRCFLPVYDVRPPCPLVSTLWFNRPFFNALPG